MALGTSTPYHLDVKATYLVLCCIATLSLSLLISIFHGDFSAIAAVLGLVAIQIGSQDLLFLYGVLSPASLIIDVFWLIDQPGVRGHGWLVFFTVCDMIAKCTGSVVAWSLYTSTSGDAQYSMAPTSSTHQSGGFVPPQAPTSYQAPASHPQSDPFASYAPPRQDAHTGPAAQETSAYQPFPTSQQVPTHVL